MGTVLNFALRQQRLIGRRRFGSGGKLLATYQKLVQAPGIATSTLIENPLLVVLMG